MNAPATGASSMLRARRLPGAVLCALVVSVDVLHAQKLIATSEINALAAGPPDQKIQYGPAPQQFGNLRLPKGQGLHPLVIFIHGGCWLSAYDITHAGSIEQALADSGYAVWSIEYRRVGDQGGGWPGTFLDIAHGVDHVREIAQKYSLDLNHVIASGHSAGGEFALWLAARNKIPRSSEVYVASPLKVQGVVALAPAPDLESLEAAGTCGKVIDKLIGGSPSDFGARYSAVSPMKLAPIAVPSTLIVGAQDRGFGPNGRAYFAHAKEAGDSRVKLVEAPESGHFELIAPKTSTWPIVIGESRRCLPRFDSRVIPSAARDRSLSAAVELPWLESDPSSFHSSG
jgi:acetyl esterase/lipase